MGEAAFEWDDAKAEKNVRLHGITFEEAKYAFWDPKRIVAQDAAHSGEESRWFCIGRLTSGRICTVRYTQRSGQIRIIGAGYWRKGRKLYEKENHLHGR